MRFRQVHLDCHTSSEIEDMGKGFSKENFQTALKIGHVNSITLFSKCHHGNAYHPSNVDMMHPHLKFDLLKAQIEAAHEIGVKTPIYLSAGFDEKLVREHPEWLMRNPDETILSNRDFTSAGYHRLCLNSPYLDVLLSQIEEVLLNYDGDGIFLDIVGQVPCYCQNCVKSMLDKGWDPYDSNNAYKQAVETYNTYTQRVRETVDRIKPGHPVFHNNGHIHCGNMPFINADSHLEIESLPTGGWGYDHFPMSAAYARTLNKEFLGMTGKFHRSWGEFGGFKHVNALRYEASLSIANGAKISVGDQLHPTAEMNLATYKLIGEAFKEVEEKEPWLDKVDSVADIAVLSQEALFYHMHPGIEIPFKNQFHGNTGASRILLEGKYLFDMVDVETDLSKYKLVILTDDSIIDSYVANKLQDFIDNGGKILASGNSALMDDNSGFAFDLGAKYIGPSKFVPSYLSADYEMEGLFSSEYVIDQPSNDIEATGEVIAYKQNSYFNRSTFHFSSHRQTPNDPSTKLPAITMGKDGAYICYNIFTEYRESGALIAKQTVKHVIDLLLGENKTLTTSLPSLGVVTLMDQYNENRYVNHLLYATPVKRGRNVEVIEDIIPIYNTEVTIKLDVKPKRVYLAPQQIDIDYDYTEGILTYNVPKIECHQMVVIDY